MIILVYIIALIIFSFYYRHLYRKLETITEKSLFVLFLVVYFSPVILYIIDKYNLATIIFGDLNMDRWFDFSGAYVTAIIAAVINSVILLLITFKQIELQKNDNIENTRLQNAPILEYLVSTDNKTKSKKYDEFVILNKGESFRIYVDVENIGLGHARHIDFGFVIDNIKINGINKKDDRQTVIKRDTDYVFSLDFNLSYDVSTDNMHEMKIISYYEDVLYNKYTQEVVLSLKIMEGTKKKHQLSILSSEVFPPKVERCNSK